jgi:proline iminopeptidase
MCSALPNARLKSFEASSHMPFYEEPAAYFAMVEAFLAEATG